VDIESAGAGALLGMALTGYAYKDKLLHVVWKVLRYSEASILHEGRHRQRFQLDESGRPAPEASYSRDIHGEATWR